MKPRKTSAREDFAGCQDEVSAQIELQALAAEVEMYERRVDQLNADKAKLLEDMRRWATRAEDMRERARALTTGIRIAVKALNPTNVAEVARLLSEAADKHGVPPNDG